LAIVHAELVLIHPFQEGNGSLARLLGVLMALQAGLPTLDFGGISGRGKRAYFSAVQAALGRDYRPMEEVFNAVEKRTHRFERRGVIFRVKRVCDSDKRTPSIALEVDAARKSISCRCLGLRR